MIPELLTAIFLGIVEGLTEFIPVSSTAHLIVLTEALHFRAPPGHIFEVFIQLGAILAVVVLYRVKLWKTIIGLPSDKTAQAFAMNIVLATIPALIAGAFGRDFIKEHLYDPHIIAVMLILGGIILIFFDKKFSTPKIDNIDAVSPKLAFLIGCCQAIALIPGVSRSGATIMGALALGLSRPAAAEFSFFLAIPVMCAAVAYDVMKGWSDIVSYGHFHIMLAGLVAAFITAMIVIKTVLAFLNRHGFTPFGWYRIVAGIVILLLFI